MIDINFIKENVEETKILFKKRGCNVDVDAFLKLHFELNSKKSELDKLRFEQKKANIEKAKEIKEKVLNLKSTVNTLEQKRNEIWLTLPNILAEDTPEGKDDTENVEIKRCGTFPDFNFSPQSHDVIGKNLGILDLERGAKVSGSGFYYILGQGSKIAMAVYFLAWKILNENGFSFMIPPVFTDIRAFLGTGYFPFEPKGNYKIENKNLYAIGTSEQSILAFHDNEILKFEDLPLKYASLTPCFRTEDGSYGKCSKGGFRVHQFHKMEQIIFCKPEESEKLHEACLSNIEELMKILEIPYRIVRVCTGDMGAPGYKKYDVESWFPSFNGFRETHSNTNLWDFQTRRLNIRVQHNGEKFFPHTISSTMATDRLIFSLMENFQKSDGTIDLPISVKNLLERNFIF